MLFLFWEPQELAKELSVKELLTNLDMFIYQQVRKKIYNAIELSLSVCQ